jgi:hypothetical protein
MNRLHSLSLKSKNTNTKTLKIMSVKHFAIALFLVTFVSISCKKEEEPTPTPTPAVPLQITPGVGITEVKLGEIAQKAIDFFGVPFPVNASSGGVYTHYIVYTSKGAVVYCVPTTEATFNAQMKIGSLKFSAPFAGKTEKGIGVGSTKAAVKAAYGDPATSSPSAGDKYNIGIIFIYDAGDKVKSIEVK